MANINRNRATTVLARSEYSLFLERVGIDKFIKNVDEPNGAFQNNNANRDAYLATLLKQHKSVKEACEALDVQMKASKVPQQTVAATVDGLAYAVLKNALFDAYIAQQQAMRVEQGVMPDSFFAAFNQRSPAPENAEAFQEDVKDFPADMREEGETAPSGLSTDYVSLYGFEWQIEDGSGRGLTARIAEGLEDLRIHLENVRASHGYKGNDRLAFFIEQTTPGVWTRHNGSVHNALLEFGMKQIERSREKAEQQERFFAKALEEAKLAA